jgi:acyl transferase domain-containing protein
MTGMTMPALDVAIIGLACRFPAVTGPHQFWRLLCDGLEATRLPGDVAEFDADFFNVSPREARAMDPRQRLALELTWELFEDAFVLPETLRGERVAIYLGAMNDDYAFLTLAAGDADHYSFTGISRGMIANRVSHAFGLRGTSMTIDSGQSASLVAVHLACESIRSGESALAVAGGIHLNLARETNSLETEFGAVSTSGHTYAFDERADGYVPSEGAGLVLLKPLRAALDDGDRIRAIIRGSAAGNAADSGTGLTVPSAPGQVDVIRRALSGGGLDGSEIDYVEAHGTGTAVGDPIEARALGEVFARRRQGPLIVGSVKTNIGHTGAAAGIAGLLKTVLAVENGLLPASLNYVNPGIDLERLGIRVNTALTRWPAADRPRRAGVSSLGMGGTNAHVIVEERATPPQRQQGLNNIVNEPDSCNPVVAWVVSGRSKRALANQAARLLAHITGDGDLRPVDVAWSLATTRSVFEHRAVVVGADRAALTAGLTGLTGRNGVGGGAPSVDVVVGQAGLAAKTAFVFPGQGSQWLGMGERLYRRFPVFRQAFDEAAQALRSHLRLPLREVMWGDDAALLESTEFAQPALFGVQVAVAELLRSWGVAPDFVMGHSVGEITAAYVAGVLTLTDAAKVVAARGRLMSALPAGGVMVAVAAGEDEVTSLLTDELGAEVCIAAVNGPNAVVLSGTDAPVLAVADRLAQRGRRVHRLAVSHAFHSASMEPMLRPFAEVLADVSAAQARIALVSNVTGKLAGPGYGSAQYWVEHVRRPVRFLVGVRTVEALGANIFVEVGPGAGLAASVEQSLAADAGVSVTTMAADRPEVDSLVGAAGQYFAAGARVDWAAVLGGLGGHRVRLPTYGFVRERFWLPGFGGGDGGDAVPPAASPSVELAGLLNGLAPKEQHRQLLDMVCSHAANVLGHATPDDIDAQRAFQDLGFDSVTGVQLCNRLKIATGLPGSALPRTLVFDYPTPTALAAHLGQQLLGGHDHADPAEPADHAAEADEERIWSSLRKVPLQELRRIGLLDKLLLLAGESENAGREPTVSDDVIDSLSPDALIAMALNPVEDNKIR